MDILPSNTPQKQCTGPCGRTLPATKEYFYSNGKSRLGESVLRPDCKECKTKKAKAHYQKPEVKEQRTVYSKAYRAIPENQEHIRQHKKDYYSQPEVIEHKREYTREYRTDPEVLARKREGNKKYLSRPEKREIHRNYDRVFQHNRRARIRAIPGTYTLQQIQDKLKAQRHCCYYCSSTFEKKNNKYVYHIDHIVPVSKGGSNDIHNIVLACPPCNQHKNARSPHEWPEGGRLL